MKDGSRPSSTLSPTPATQAHLSITNRLGTSGLSSAVEKKCNIDYTLDFWSDLFEEGLQYNNCVTQVSYIYFP